MSLMKAGEAAAVTVATALAALTYAGQEMPWEMAGRMTLPRSSPHRLRPDSPPPRRGRIEQRRSCRGGENQGQSHRRRLYHVAYSFSWAGNRARLISDCSASLQQEVACMPQATRRKIDL
jgi:hypothetical protein